MIPKIIHQVWVGDKPIPDHHLKWIKKLKKLNPDFEYKLWTTNDFGENAFTKSALNDKRYAYYSDWIRTNILYNYGGIYLDTDIEHLKPIPKILYKQISLPLETEFTTSNYVMSSPKKSRLMKNLIQEYNSYDDDEFDTFKWVADKVLKKVLPKTFGKCAILNSNDGSFKRNSSINFINPLDTAPYYPFGTENFRKLKENITSDTWCVHHWNSYFYE